MTPARRLRRRDTADHTRRILAQIGPVVDDLVRFVVWLLIAVTVIVGAFALGTGLWLVASR